ncbi:hypothetical protein HPB49_007016 [Dermacentor silvarum]|uniref:Uncharacterized protein n=1 Tax=Dermacentor silvarum TaxID=543639 RepID=A0ACB8CVZ4_DERSI|nr:hypothetical protein HPB49_007016 [Dermacentor silvarum]
MPRQRREKTDDQIAAEKRRRADARRLKRAQETSEQRAERLAQDRESRRTRRQQDTDQVRDARIVSDREAKRAYRAAEETPEARAKRVIKGRQAQRKRRVTETPEDGAQRRGKDREAKRARPDMDILTGEAIDVVIGSSRDDGKVNVLSIFCYPFDKDVRHRDRTAGQGERHKHRTPHTPLQKWRAPSAQTQQ